ncbi:hypothetical protein B0H12DRAFT_359155 [Mycena haematopus]|nr:hypothetical protein B0H12DRAFT_359155 [Mycena haematopus]
MSSATLGTGCLRNPHDELVVAFEQLLQLQSGPNLAKLVAILSPGPAVSRVQSGYTATAGSSTSPPSSIASRSSSTRMRAISRDMHHAKTTGLLVASMLRWVGPGIEG